MAKRDELIKGLRELADMFESHPAFPAPYDIELQIFYNLRPDGGLGPDITIADVRAAMTLAPGNWSKSYSDSYVSYRKDFSEFVAIELTFGRETVCRKVQTGIRHVEATDARDVPIYEWICESDELEPADD